jgi:hypothetical protein
VKCVKIYVSDSVTALEIADTLLKQPSDMNLQVILNMLCLYNQCNITVSWKLENIKRYQFSIAEKSMFVVIPLQWNSWTAGSGSQIEPTLAPV